MASVSGSDPGADEWAASIAEAFEPFSEEEREELRLYREHVEEFAGWELANQPKMVARIGTSQGSFVEGATKKDMTALLTTYRKVSVAQKDRGTFEKTRNLLVRHAKDKETDEARIGLDWLKNLKRWRKHAMNESRALGYKVVRPDGSVETLKPKEIRDWLINGVVFHSDENGRKMWEAFGGWDSVPLLMNFLVMLNDEVAIFRAMDEVVGLVLDEPQLHR
jgi:hypothetical protein